MQLVIYIAYIYRVYRRFVHAKLGYGGLVISLSPYRAMTKLPQILLLTLKVVDGKKITILPYIFTMVHSKLPLSAIDTGSLARPGGFNYL